LLEFEQPGDALLELGLSEPQVLERALLALARDAGTPSLVALPQGMLEHSSHVVGIAPRERYVPDMRLLVKAPTPLTETPPVAADCVAEGGCESHSSRDSRHPPDTRASVWVAFAVAKPHHARCQSSLVMMGSGVRVPASAWLVGKSLQNLTF
jgi:hypothetical protein